jgi:hypothetical protein
VDNCEEIGVDVVYEYANVPGGITQISGTLQYENAVLLPTESHGTCYWPAQSSEGTSGEVPFSVSKGSGLSANGLLLHGCNFLISPDAPASFSVEIEAVSTSSGPLSQAQIGALLNSGQLDAYDVNRDPDIFIIGRTSDPPSH